MRDMMFILNRSVSLRSVLLGCLGLFLCLSPIEAKTKRLDSKLTDTAETLAKDRETAFSGGKAMPLADFQAQWTAFAQKLNEEYQGHTVKLKTFGVDVRARKAYAHLLYMALRVQQGSPLDPPVHVLISHHPFLQELILEGACYTGGDPYPKKLKDLIQAHSEMLVVLHDSLDGWDKDYRQAFVKEFGELGIARREKQ